MIAKRSTVLAPRHPVVVTVQRHARIIMPLAILAASNLARAADGDITAADFTSVGTKVLSYLGYAVAAGLTVLVATVAAQAGWKFFGKFIK
jgi:hypothetical protein